MEDNKNGIEEEILDKEEILEEEPNVDENSEEVSSEEEAEEIDELKELREKHMLFEGKNKKLQNELDTLKDRLLRINAEYENYRKRTDKEKEEFTVMHVQMYFQKCFLY